MTGQQTKHSVGAMPKLGMHQLRRRQLIEATFATVERHGLADTTLQRVAREAGLSTGIIHHYFADKNALLAATMRTLLVELRGDAVERLAVADDAEARLRAILATCFAPEQFRPALVAAWLAFWAQSPHSAALSRLRRLYDRRLHTNLVSALAELLPRADAENAARTLAALIDGLWLRAGAGDGFSRGDALAIVEAYLERVLGERAPARTPPVSGATANPRGRGRSGDR